MLKGYEFIYVIYHKFAVYVNVTVLDLVARGLTYKLVIHTNLLTISHESSNIYTNLLTAEYIFGVDNESRTISTGLRRDFMRTLKARCLLFHPDFP